MPNITLTRRHNVLALFHDHARRAVAAGAAPKGLEQAFAATLQISPSMWSQIKSSRPIGDKLARQIETHAAKPPGWLDDEHAEAAAAPTLSAAAVVPTSAEAAFLDLALAAWRCANPAGRQVLQRQLETMLQGA